MKLTYFSIHDYWSIGKAELENLQSAAILIGPNNEGILAAKRANAGADTSALEEASDRHVNARCGLTPDEIKIVEESVR